MPDRIPPQFVEDLAPLLLREQMHFDAASVQALGLGTFESQASVLGVLRPTTVEQVAGIVRACRRHGVPHFALSTGRNWGYGSTASERPGIAIDLGGMNRIRLFDDELGYVRVEPGVTMAQLNAFLRSKGGRFWLDATGSSPHCSIVGNTLERGFGHTPYADHAAHASMLEVVLPDGDVIDTGFGAFGAVKAQHVYPPGLGPSIDGLFFQSGFGIVTAMTVWLMPAPERTCAFFIALKRAEQFPALVDALRPLRLAGRLRSAIHLGNAYRVLPSFTQFPWDAQPEGGALQGEALAALQRRHGVQAWHGSGALYGTDGEIREGRRSLRRALRGLDAGLIFVDDARAALLQRLQPLLARMGGWGGRQARQIDLLAPAYALLKGVPTDRFLPTVYWRKRAPAPAQPDPARDRCGLIWCAVLSELRGDQAAAVLEITTRTLLAASYEPAVTVTFLSERCLEHVISISFDRDIEGEDARARLAFEQLLAALIAEGYFPYRLPTFAQGLMQQAGARYRRLLSNFKDALDPGHLYADGRYPAGVAGDHAAP